MLATNYGLLYPYNRRMDQLFKKKPQTIPGLGLKFIWFIRESGGARTLDLRLKRPLLYQLSYRLGTF